MEKQYGTSNGHSKWTHPVYCNTDRTSQPQAGASEPRAGGILAGGWGTRFWPLSRSQYPKQVLRLLGSESMLQSTVARLLPRIPPERLAVVTNAAQAGLIYQELH